MSAAGCRWWLNARFSGQFGGAYRTKVIGGTTPEAIPADGRAFRATMREISAVMATNFLPGTTLLLLLLCRWWLVVNGANIVRSSQRADVGSCRFLATTQVDCVLSRWKWSEGQELLFRSDITNARHDAGSHLLVCACATQLGGAR